MRGFGALRSVLLEHLGFDNQREPIAATDFFGGPTDSLPVNGRKLGLNVVVKMPGMVGSLSAGSSFGDDGTGSGGASVAPMLFEPVNGTWNRARGHARSRTVSAANTAQQIVLDISNLNQVIDILSVASAGTATLLIEVSQDNSNFVTIDSIAAALTQVKHYNNTTVGATTALTPLGFRWVRITAGAAGVGNTTTLTVGVK